MSVVVKSIRKSAGKVSRVALCAVLWVFVVPVARLVPRRKDWIVVIGRDRGNLTDNAKYFFLQSKQELSPNVHCIFITEHKTVVKTLREAGYHVSFYPSKKSILYLMRTGSVVVDADEWLHSLMPYFFSGAKLIQMWHGVGFKKIQRGRSINASEGDMKLFYAKVITEVRFFLRSVLLSGRYGYDVVNTTSRFYKEEVFEPAFASRHYLLAGYPRNTFGSISDPVAKKIIWSTVDPHVSRYVSTWKREERNLILITPTFRHNRPSPMNLNEEVLSYLDEWCSSHRAEMIFKFHISDSRAYQVKGKHLHVCAHDSDIYPLMPLSDALVTDYSSIYMDYLLLDKPVLFFSPDLHEYISNDRGIQFNYNEMTPGPKVANWLELTSQLEKQWAEDEYIHARNRMKKKAFDELSQSHATSKILKFMRAKKWILS